MEFIGDNKEKWEAIDHYCFEFFAAESHMFFGIIKDIEKSGHSVDEFLQVPLCRMEEMPNYVGSPMLHVIADDPAKHERFLSTLMQYYTKKRNNPSGYIAVLNAVNTNGETLLDYINTLRIRGNVYGPKLGVFADKVVEFACSTGGEYKRYKATKT